MSRQLFEALAASDTNAVRRLVKRGVSLNDKKDRSGKTVLHHATLRGATSFARALLKHGASPNVPDARGWTPLHFAASHRYASIDLCTAMLEHKPDLDRGRLTPGAVARLYGSAMAPRLERPPATPPRHEALERRLLYDPDPDLWSVYADWILEQGHPSGAWLAFTGDARAQVLADIAGVVTEVLSWQREEVPASLDWLQVEWLGPFPARLRIGALSNDDVIRLEVLHHLLAHPLMRFVRQVEAPWIRAPMALVFERLNQLPPLPFLQKLSLELGAPFVGARVPKGATLGFAPHLEELAIAHHGGVLNLIQPGVKRVELIVDDRSRVLSFELPDAVEMRIWGAEAAVTEAKARAIGPTRDLTRPIRETSIPQVLLL